MSVRGGGRASAAYEREAARGALVLPSRSVGADIGHEPKKSVISGSKVTKAFFSSAVACLVIVPSGGFAAERPPSLATAAPSCSHQYFSHALSPSAEMLGSLHPAGECMSVLTTWHWWHARKKQRSSWSRRACCGVGG